MTLDPRVRKDDHSFCHARLDRASSIFVLAPSPQPLRQAQGRPSPTTREDGVGGYSCKHRIAMPCYDFAMPCYALLCPAMPCYVFAMSRYDYVMNCYVFCYAMLCFAMSCYDCAMFRKAGGQRGGTGYGRTRRRLAILSTPEPIQTFRKENKQCQLFRIIRTTKVFQNGMENDLSVLIIAIIHPRMLELPVDDRVDRSSAHVYRSTGKSVPAI